MTFDGIFIINTEDQIVRGQTELLSVTKRKAIPTTSHKSPLEKAACSPVTHADCPLYAKYLNPAFIDN